MPTWLVLQVLILLKHTCMLIVSWQDGIIYFAFGFFDFSKEFLNDCIQPLDSVLRLKLFPALADRNQPGNIKQDLLTVSISVGGKYA